MYVSLCILRHLWYKKQGKLTLHGLCMHDKVVLEVTGCAQNKVRLPVSVFVRGVDEIFNELSKSGRIRVTHVNNIYRVRTILLNYWQTEDALELFELFSDVSFQKLVPDKIRSLF